MNTTDYQTKKYAEDERHYESISVCPEKDICSHEETGRVEMSFVHQDTTYSTALSIKEAKELVAKLEIYLQTKI